MANAVNLPLSNLYTVDSGGHRILQQEGDAGYLAMLLTVMSAADDNSWNGASPNAYAVVAARLEAIDTNNSLTKLYKNYFARQIRG
jgi:hypothetical protein